MKSCFVPLNNLNVRCGCNHYNFRDIENMLDRVILLKDGKIQVDEKIENLKAKVKKLEKEIKKLIELSATYKLQIR